MNTEKPKNTISFVCFLAIAVLAGFFCFSYIGGSPNFTTSHILITVREWINNGIVQCGFIGRMPAGEMGLSAGREYISYPIFCFLLPYLYSLFNGHIITPFEIEFLGFCVHLMIGLFICKIGLMYYSFKDAFLATAFYLLMPGMLYYNTQNFYGDTVVNLFVVMYVYFTLMYLRSFRKKHLIFLLAVTFLGTITEYFFWFVLFFSCLYLFGAGILERKKRVFLLPLLITFIAFVALALNIGLYAYGVGGFDNLITILKERLHSRGGEVGIIRVADSFRWFIEMTSGQALHGIVLILSLGGFTLAWFRRDKTAILMLTFIFLAMLAHIFKFQDLFINHPFLITKFGLFAGLAIIPLLHYYVNNMKRTAIAFLVMIFLGIYWHGHMHHQYSETNPLRKNSKYFGEMVYRYGKGVPVAYISISLAQKLMKQEQGYLLLPMYYFYSKKDTIWYHPDKKIRSESILLLPDQEFDRERFTLIERVNDINIVRLREQKNSKRSF